MVAGVGIDGAAFPRDHPIEPVVIEGSGRRGWLPGCETCCASIELFAAAELAGGNEVLDAVTTMGMTTQGFDTHAASATIPIFMTSLGLPEFGLKASPAAPSGIRIGRTHQRIDDVADAQGEFLHPARHPGTDDMVSGPDRPSSPSNCSRTCGRLRSSPTGLTGPDRFYAATWSSVPGVRPQSSGRSPTQHTNSARNQSSQPRSFQWRAQGLREWTREDEQQA